MFKQTGSDGRCRQATKRDELEDDTGWEEGLRDGGKLDDGLVVGYWTWFWMTGCLDGDPWWGAGNRDFGGLEVSGGSGNGQD